MRTKKYSDSDEAMLIKTKVAIKYAIEDVKAFAKVQPSINVESLGAFNKEVNDALAKFVGMDKFEQLRSATNRVEEMAEDAFKNLRLLKTLVEINFKDDAKELFNHLGYNNYYGDVSQRKQEPTISLLSVVARDSERLKEMFAKKSLPINVIDEIVKLAVDMPQAETDQEQLKGGSKPITVEQRKTLNDIYERIMDICKLGRVIFADDEIKRNQYIFKNLGGINRKSNTNNKENNTDDEPDKK